MQAGVLFIVLGFLGVALAGVIDLADGKLDWVEDEPVLTSADDQVVVSQCLSSAREAYAGNFSPASDMEGYRAMIEANFGMRLLGAPEWEATEKNRATCWTTHMQFWRELGYDIPIQPEERSALEPSTPTHVASRTVEPSTPTHVASRTVEPSTPTPEALRIVGIEDRTYDVSGVRKVEDIAALVPREVADTGMLIIGTAPDYAPAEFLAEDQQTPIGYNVDLGQALGNVLGLEAKVRPGKFDGLLPGIGSEYDLGISSFTITDERIANFNMIAYMEVGSSFAIPVGNPSNFDPDDLCGETIAVQAGTWQHEELRAMGRGCSALSQIEILLYDSHSEAAMDVLSGKLSAFYAESVVTSHLVANSTGQLRVIGGIRGSAPQGIVIAQENADLVEATQKAMQHLIDNGTWAAILESWGAAEAAVSTAELNPRE